MIKLTGKILDEDGHPLNQVVAVKEVYMPGIPYSAGQVWTDPDTGEYTFLVSGESALIIVETFGYHPQTFTAKSMPSVVRLQSAMVVEGTRKPKDDNTIWWLLGGIAVIGALSYKTGSSPAPVNKPKPKVKEVTV